MAITRHQYRVYVKAPVEQVWNAILDPEFTRRYFHGIEFDAPPVAGEPYRTSMHGSPAVDGTIEVCEPPHRLVMTWHVLYDAAMEQEAPGRVEWTLAAAADGLTQIDLVHGDLARSPLTWAHVRTGWVWILDGLKTLLETGEVLPPVGEAANEADAIDDPAADWHRAQGVECNNSIWDLVGEPASPERDEELLRRGVRLGVSLAASRPSCPGERGSRRVHALQGAPPHRAARASAPLRRPGHGHVRPSSASPTSTSPTPTRPGPALCRRSVAPTRPPSRGPRRRRRPSPIRRTRRSSTRTSPKAPDLRVRAPPRQGRGPPRRLPGTAR